MSEQKKVVAVGFELRNTEGDVYDEYLFAGIPADQASRAIAKVKSFVDEFVLANDCKVYSIELEDSGYLYVDPKSLSSFKFECYEFYPGDVVDLTDEELYERIEIGLSWFFGIDNPAALLRKIG